MSLFPNDSDKNLYYTAAWNILLRTITRTAPGKTYSTGQGLELLEQFVDKQNPYKEQLSDLLYNKIDDFVNNRRPNEMLYKNVPQEEVCKTVGTVTNIIASAIENGYTINRVNKQLNKQIEELIGQKDDFSKTINIDGELVKDFTDIEKRVIELKTKVFGEYLQESINRLPKSQGTNPLEQLTKAFGRQTLISNMKQEPQYQEQLEKIENAEKNVIKEVLKENSKNKQE